MRTNQLQVGAAEVEFTPAPGLTLLGQMYQRIAKCKRDPLTANAIAFRQGRETVVLVSVDICVLDGTFVRIAQQRFARRTGLPARRLLLHATHTHVAPSVVNAPVAPANPAFVERLQRAVLDVAVQALRNLMPAEIFSGTGQMEQMGWNRRAMFKDGSSRMYGNSTEPGFIGMEGPRDPALPVLFVPGTVVVVNFSTHPNSLEGERFYSADLPGEVRRQLKALLGPEVVVVYLTSSAGNTAPSILDPNATPQPWRDEAGVRRSGLYLAGEAAKVIASATKPVAAPVLRVAQTTLRIPVRPWPKPQTPTNPERDPRIKNLQGWSQHYVLARANWARRLAEDNPVAVQLNVVRLGDIALCTNPAELFVEFGLAIRQHSPARVTFISELTNGYAGYVPTRKAFARGGYETLPAPGSKLVPQAGSQIVTATRQLLTKVFVR